MALRLNGSNTGYVELDVPADAGSHTLTLPDGGGSSGQYLQTNGSGGLSWQTVTDTNTFGLTHLTTQSISGSSSITITGIPTTATMVFVNVNDISTISNVAARFQMRVGNGSVDSTSGNYSWNAVYIGSSPASEGDASASHMRIFHGGISGAGHLNQGTITFLRTSDQGWLMTANIGEQATAGYYLLSAGRYNQNTGIDRVNFFTSGGNNWDDGEIMVSYQ